jgi:hypothetical protein
MKIIIANLFFFVYCFSCIAQKNLKPGFIVSDRNDTLTGFIDTRGDKMNSVKCVFYLNTDDEPTTYLPGQIRSYQIEKSRYYISKSVELNNETKVVFLEYLVNGITNLYFLRDITGDYFFIEKGNEMYELRNKSRILNDGQNQYLQESNLYIGQLKVIYSEAKNLMPVIEKARFDRKTMIKLSEEYHNQVCLDGSCITYASHGPDVKISFGPTVRYDFNTAKYQGFLSKYNLNNYGDIRAGATLNLQMLRLNEKFNIEVSALYGNDYSKGTYSTFFGNDESRYSVNISKDKISLMTDLKFTYPAGKIKPSIGLGVEYGQVISQNSKYVFQTFEDGILGFEHIETDLIDNSFDIGVTGTIGLIFSINKRALALDAWSKIGRSFYREYGTINESSDVSYYSKVFCFGLITTFYF